MNHLDLKNDILIQGEKKVVTPLRRKALSLLKNTPIPTTRSEDWRYTDLSEIEGWDLNFTMRTPSFVQQDKINELFLQLENKSQLVFIDGHLSSTHSKIPKDFILCHQDEDSIEASDFFDLTNALFCEETLTLNIPDNTELSSPFCILHIATEEGHDTQHAARLCINVGKFSKITIAEFFITQGNFYYFSNPLLEIKLNEGAKVEHALSQENSDRALHIGKTLYALEKDTQLETFSYNSGAKLARHNFNINLLCAGANAKINGLYALEGERLNDNFLTINHYVGDTQSSQLFKGILDGKTQGVFTGKIFIHKDAQRSSATQLNSNLLLGSKAKIKTRPQLEIYADDVKCTHGATIGQLDPEQLFYLESRGIKKEQAQKMITSAFSRQVIDEITHSKLRDLFHQKMGQKFGGTKDVF